jgi:hypothetical protein
MIGGINSSNQQYNLKINSFVDLRDQTNMANKLKQNAKKRKIEETNHSEQSDYKFQPNYDTTTKNVFEEGKLLVESYDENGKLIRITPLGYIPFDHHAIRILI